ncbi:MAG TPA: hypothetical protein VGL70_20740 [Candidatus Binatia bacterium]|jgi:hypothetical protein
MDLQKINVKIFIADPSPIQAESFIEIFNSWIQDSDGEYYDLADYSHVPAGTGILLVAHEANVGIDNSDNRWGLLYSRKQPAVGSNREKLQAAFMTALEYCRRIELEPLLQGRVRFRGDEANVLVNDRLLAPNTEDTFAAIRPDVEALARVLYAGSDFSLEREPDSRRRFGLHMKAADPFDVGTLIKNMGIVN